MRTHQSFFLASFLVCATGASACNHAVEAGEPGPDEGNTTPSTTAVQAAPLEQLGSVSVADVEFLAVTSLTRAPDDNIVFSLVQPAFRAPVQLNEYRVTDSGAFQFLAATCPTEVAFNSDDYELSLTRVGNQDLLFGAYDFRTISLYDVTNPSFIRCKTFEIAPATNDIFQGQVGALDTEGDALALVTRDGELTVWRFTSYDAPPIPIHRSQLQRDVGAGRLSDAAGIDFVREPSPQPDGVEGAIYVADGLGVSKWYLENGAVRYLGNVRAGNSWKDLVVVPIPPLGAGRPPQQSWIVGAAFNGLQVVHAGAPKEPLGALVGQDRNSGNDFLSSVETLGRLRDTRVFDGQTVNDVVGDLVYVTSERLPSRILRYNFDSIDFTKGGVVNLTPDTAKQFGPQRQTPHDVKAQLNGNLVFVAGEEGITSHSCSVSRGGISTGAAERGGLWALLGMGALAWRRRRSRAGARE